MKRPFESVLEIYRRNLSKSIENDKRNHEFLHQFTTWLLSFSIGGLYIIASNFGNIKSTFSYPVIKSLIILLTISVISGIVHRLLLYAFQTLYSSNVFYVEGALSEELIMNSEPVDVSSENDINTLINLLKSDYDEDDFPALKLYYESNDDGKEQIIGFLRKKYKDVGDWAKRDYEIAFSHVLKILKDAFGLSDKEIEQQKKLHTKTIRVLRYAFVYALYLSCLSFISVLILLACAY